MAILPWHDKLVKDSVYTEEEMRWLALSQYVMLLLCLALLGWVLRNIWVILYMQGRFRVLPMLVYYVLATLQIIVRAIFSVWLVPAYFESWLFVLNFPFTAKAAIGFNQTWVISELCLIVRYSISLAKTNIIQQTSVNAPTKSIQRGRVLVAALVVIFTVSMVIWFLVAQHKMSAIERF